MDRPQDPVLPGDAATDYERYLRTDELLALQKAPEEMAHRDELLFQTVHQTAELWLKLAGTEIAAATALIADDALPAGTRLLRRATECVAILIDNLRMLEHLSPWDYRLVRRVLGHGSGFDSPGFNRLLELAPPLGDAFAAALERRQVSLTDLYRRGDELDELYQVAERLLDLDERMTVWRFQHFQVVRRIIGGHVVGTQGTPVEVLGKRIGQMLYPELWEARDRLTALSPLDTDDST